MNAPVVEVAHVSKRFCRDLRRSLRYGIVDIAAELVGRSQPEDAPLRPDEFDALDDVSFTLHAGESLAVVGGNGAGKTTLLKLLYGLLKPDRGEVRVHGRMGAIIELGTGFDPVLTGRENIALNATMVGLGSRDLGTLVEQVVDFAELEDAIDTPVRYYSSGMQARLAFAVAAHLEPDVLLVDEVLAVGDLAFQRKCVRHMLAFLDRGGSLVFVSHNAHEIQTVCRRGLLLEEGRCEFTGTAVEAVARYHAALKLGADPDRNPLAEPDAECPVVIERVLVSTPGDGAARGGDPLRLTVALNSVGGVDVVWGFSIWTSDQWVCITGEVDLAPRRLESGPGELTCTIPRLPLAPGRYAIRSHVVDAATMRPFESLESERNTTTFTVAGEESLKNNWFVMNGLLVSVDVEWGSR